MLASGFLNKRKRGQANNDYYHNGTATKYTYDAWSTKLFGIVTEDPTHDPLKLLQDREYTYSRAGDILQIVDHVQKVTYDYAYDMLHRLVSEKLSGVNAPIATRVETITLDYTGTGPVHGVKQITLNGVSRTCAYDPNGNMVTSPDFTNATNPLNRAITYDADNMPTRIVHANGKTVDFVYDGVAKRTKKLVLGGKTVLYLGDHFEVENGVNIKYIFGGNLRLAQIKGSLTSYFHKDHLNSTAAVTNEAGVKIEATTYEPFGSTRTQEGTEVSAYKFTDQEADVETGLYNYDARLYDPVLGMFVTPDSIVPRPYDPQSLNRYSYCRNNPLIYVDPSGHTDTDGGGDPVPEGRISAPDNSGPDVPPDKRNPIIRGYEIVRGYLARRHRECEQKDLRDEVNDFLNNKGYKVAVVFADIHAAILIDNNGSRTLYDPGGTYKDGQGRGTNDTFSDDDGIKIDFQDYINYHLQDGGKVKMISFDLSPDEVKQILSRIEEQGGVRGGICAQATTSVISGIGPFKDIKLNLITSIPIGLEYKLNRIKKE